MGAKFLAILALAIACAPATALAAAPSRHRATVAFRIRGADPLSVKFRAVLKARILKDPRLKLIPKLEKADMRLVSPSTTVDWDDLAGRLVMIYVINGTSAKADDRFAGVCFASDMDKCARELIKRSEHFLLGW